MPLPFLHSATRRGRIKNRVKAATKKTACISKSGNKGRCPGGQRPFLIHCCAVCRVDKTPRRLRRQRSASPHRATWESSPCSRNARSSCLQGRHPRCQAQRRASALSPNADQRGEACRRAAHGGRLKAETVQRILPRNVFGQIRPRHLKYRAHAHAARAAIQRSLPAAVNKTASMPSAAALRKIAPMFVGFITFSSTAMRREFVQTSATLFKAGRRIAHSMPRVSLKPVSCVKTSSSAV